jgi:hypothetical protein
MSSSSSSSSAGTPFYQTVAEKLTPENFPVWKAVILPAFHGARFVKLLTGACVRYVPVTN